MNFPPKTILVAFDFSKRSLIAWNYAGLMAKRVGARLQAIYVSPWVVPPPEGFFIEPELSDAQRAAITHELDAMLHRPGASRVAEGNVAEEIVKAARACRADLIVMATEGAGLRRLALGSMTEAVTRLSPVPVISLRRKAALPRSILAPIDATDHSRAGLRYAQSVAHALGASLTLLHVGKANPLLPTILKAASAHDLVVLSEHRKGVLRDAAFGTTAERLLSRCEVPVLCVPAPPAANGRPRLAKRVLQSVGGKLYAV